MHSECKLQITEMEEKNKNKISDVRMMQGICLQWFNDKYGVNEEFILYYKILRLTFGCGKRYSYIKSELLPFKDRHTLKKYRDLLVEKGILKWNKTKGYTRYEILEPKEEIERFILEV